MSGIWVLTPNLIANRGLLIRGTNPSIIEHPSSDQRITPTLGAPVIRDLRCSHYAMHAEVDGADDMDDNDGDSDDEEEEEKEKECRG